MVLNLSGENISAVIQFSILGMVCWRYNKPVAKELAKIYSIPFKYFFGEKPWVIKLDLVFNLWMRVTLYGGVFVSAVIIVLTVGNIFNIL